MLRTIRSSALAAATALLCVTALTACGTTAATSGQSTPSGTAKLNQSPDQNRIVSKKVDSIAAELPDAIRKRGTLIVPTGSAQNQYPPVGFKATDNKTVIGLGPDTATLIASVLGLKLDLQDSSFEQIFLGLGSGKYDAAIGNITVTPERLTKYDMAPYRKDLAAFEVKKGSKLNVNGPEDLSGKTVSALAGTSMSQTLEKWNTELAAKSLKPIEIKSYGTSSASMLAVQSGAIDAYMTIGATAEYFAALPNAKIQVAGYPDEHGLIATVTMKGNGLAKPLCDAINHVIDNGQYAKVLARWNMASSYGIDKCVVNPTS